MKHNLSLLRQLAHEIRQSSAKPTLKNNPVMEYVFEQSRCHKETTETFCKAREELKSLTQNYLCYLHSLRKYQEINKHYSGKGERSVQDTANLVGFKLPHDSY